MATVERYRVKCAARFLCMSCEADVRNRHPGHRTLMIRFNLAADKAVDEAPEYQEILKLRQFHSDVFLSLIEEVDHASLQN